MVDALEADAAKIEVRRHTTRNRAGLKKIYLVTILNRLVGGCETLRTATNYDNSRYSSRLPSGSTSDKPGCFTHKRSSFSSAYWHCVKASV